METKPIGIYIHVPFCKRKCNYCDFCSEAANDEKIKRYTDALCLEIKDFAKDGKISVDTVFFGGGTPSILDSESFEKIMTTVRESFVILPDAEITTEVNPGTVTEEKARAYARCGVNRISIGVQSIHENELKILGRIHNYNDFLNTVNLFKNVGIDNLSADLMYGIPEQTVDSFTETLRAIISLPLSHVSCYGLIVEEGTPFYRDRDKLNLPSEDEECEMYHVAHRILTDSGFRHYEISNYAKDEAFSKHNLKYWRMDEYVGFGLSAHSYYGGKRFYNTSDFCEYFTIDSTKYRLEESDTHGIDPFEYAMLALRTDEGFSLSEYETLFGRSFISGKEEKIEKLISGEFAVMDNGRIRLTHEGFYVSNSILTDLL